MSEIRSAKITIDGLDCGILKEIRDGDKLSFEFCYFQSFLDSDYASISLDLPKQKCIFKKDKMFGILKGLLPEGVNRERLARRYHIAIDDYMSMLLIIGQKTNSTLQVQAHE